MFTVRFTYFKNQMKTIFHQKLPTGSKFSIVALFSQWNQVLSTLFKYLNALLALINN